MPAKIGMQRDISLFVLVVLLLALPSRAAPSDDDDDPGVLWKVAVGCALATVALSGVVGAVAQGPLQKAAQPLGPEVASVITPGAIAVATVGTGAVVGVTLVVAAEVMRESSR